MTARGHVLQISAFVPVPVQTLPLSQSPDGRLLHRPTHHGLFLLYGFFQFHHAPFSRKYSFLYNVHPGGLYAQCHASRNYPRGTVCKIILMPVFSVFTKHSHVLFLYFTPRLTPFFINQAAVHIPLLPSGHLHTQSSELICYLPDFLPFQFSRYMCINIHRHINR